MCYFFLFFFFFSPRIGVLCAYAANQNLSSQVKNIRRYVNSNMRDLHTFANDTPMVRVLLCRLCTSHIYHICHCPRLSVTKYNETKTDLMNVLLVSAACRDLLLFVSLCCVSCLQQIDYLLSQYVTAKNKVIYDLNSE